MSAKKILGGVIIIATIICVIVVFYATRTPAPPPPPATETTNSNFNSGTTTEALVLRQEFYISPGDTCITEKIDYKFKLRTEGHACDLQFTGDNGWLKSVPYPKEGDFDMPLNARPGPVRILTGKGETKMFRAQLYKKINVKI